MFANWSATSCSELAISVSVIASPRRSFKERQHRLQHRAHLVEVGEHAALLRLVLDEFGAQPQQFLQSLQSSLSSSSSYNSSGTGNSSNNSNSISALLIDYQS